MAGCAVDRGPVYTKDGKQYGVTASKFWRNTWWQNYERGLSYAEGEFWDEAVASFQAALATRLGQRDQRRANTYGLHFIDHYFPHRELGIVYYRLGRYQDAAARADHVPDHVESAKAKFYLNKVRQGPPANRAGVTQRHRALCSMRPLDGLLTNRFTVMAVGHVEDDTYVSAIAINGRPLFIELAEPRLAFAEEVALHDGPNTIDIVAEDLLGQADLPAPHRAPGPPWTAPQPGARGTPWDAATPAASGCKGLVSDQSRITRFVLAGQQVPLQAETAWAFRQETPGDCRHRIAAL